MPTLPEFRMVVECCRASFARAGTAHIQLPDAAIDWLRFVRLARFHRVQGLAWDALSLSGHRVAPEAAAALAADASAIAAANLKAVVEALALRDEFSDAGIPLLFLKGLTTGALAYRAPLLKMSSDIDLLVWPGDLPRAAELLRARGFAPVVPGHRTNLEAWHKRRKESLWRRSDGLHIDFHTRLADNPALIPGLDAHSPRQEVEVMPGERLPTLARDELIAYLCVHGTSSAWFRLKWISDLAGVLCPWHDLDQVQVCCRQLGAGRASAQAILLMARIFDLENRRQLERDLRPDWQTSWLVKGAMRQLAMTRVPDAPTAVPFGTARIHYTQLLLLRGIRYKFGEVWRQGRDALAHALDRWRTRSSG